MVVADVDVPSRLGTFVGDDEGRRTGNRAWGSHLRKRRRRDLEVLGVGLRKSRLNRDHLLLHALLTLKESKHGFILVQLCQRTADGRLRGFRSRTRQGAVAGQMAGLATMPACRLARMP